MQEKKNNKSLIVIIIVLLIAIFAMAVYIAYDKGESSTSNNQAESEAKEEIDTEEQKEIDSDASDNTVETNDNDDTNDNNVNSMKCTGTYYGESQGSSANGITYDYKYKYILNANGTFTADFSGVSATSGVYVINDNTISLVSKKETTGPRNQDPYYKTADYVIADDCSYFVYNDGSVSFKLMKQ